MSEEIIVPATEETTPVVEISEGSVTTPEEVVVSVPVEEVVSTPEITGEVIA